VTRRQAFHNPLFDRLIGKLPTGPMADRSAVVFGFLTSHGQNTAPLFGGDGIRASAARQIRESLFDRLHGAFESSLCPVGHFCLVNAQLLRNGLVGSALDIGHQDNLRPFHQMLWSGLLTDQSLQLGLLSPREIDSIFCSPLHDLLPVIIEDQYVKLFS
jgi:hypothetical protein